MRRAADIALVRTDHRPEDMAVGRRDPHQRSGPDGGCPEIGIVDQDDVAWAMCQVLLTARTAQAALPTCTGIWSAAAISRHWLSQMAIEKSRLELRISNRRSAHRFAHLGDDGG